MIPKLIHYSWFSGEPYPANIQALMETWRKYLPDYEFMLWDAKKLAEVNCTFANEAVSVHKWAFAADFIRVYAVYTYGGIWLDTDIELFKSFDPFLKHRMFIGREWYTHGINPQVNYLTSHCFGAEEGHPFLKECLSYYENRHFIGSYNKALPQSLRYDMTTISEIHAKIAVANYGYDWRESFDRHQVLKEGINVYPHDFFDAPGYSSMDNVVCIHRTFGGWRPGNENRLPDYSISNQHKKGAEYYLDKVINGILQLFKVRIFKCDNNKIVSVE